MDVLRCKFVHVNLCMFCVPCMYTLCLQLLAPANTSTGHIAKGTYVQQIKGGGRMLCNSVGEGGRGGLRLPMHVSIVRRVCGHAPPGIFYSKSDSEAF